MDSGVIVRECPARRTSSGGARHSLATRLLHATVAAAIVHQLLVGLVMQVPRPSGRPGDLGYALHEYVGLISMGVLLAYWIWTVVRRRERGLATLVPWFSPARRRAVQAEFGLFLGTLESLRLPPAEETSAFAGAIHGLGLLLATAMAASGVVIYAAMGADGSLALPGRLALDVHGLLANLMWVYLVGHATVALLHQANGHDVVRRMFKA